MTTETARISEQIHEQMQRIGRPVRLMEVCGTHTMAIFHHGIRSLLPEGLHLLSGPGCPVCVTAAADVEAAIGLAKEEGVVLATFGDMMRVPGRKQSLSEARAEGADVTVVYSPLDALEIASTNNEKEIVFFATGFETTSPLVAATLFEAERREVSNFSIYSVHKQVPPALAALLTSKEVDVDGFLLPGHVSTVIGSKPYRFLAEQYGKPSVITGFEATDILAGILMTLDQMVEKKPEIRIQYTRVVHPEGNPKALSMLDQYFQTEEAAWRGIGIIPESGLGLKPEHHQWDSVQRFGVVREVIEEPSACECGAVLKGIKIPTGCKLFGKACTPERPVGACMVSSEGSCAAYYKYMPRGED